MYLVTLHHGIERGFYVTAPTFDRLSILYNNQSKKREWNFGSITIGSVSKELLFKDISECLKWWSQRVCLKKTPNFRIRSRETINDGVRIDMQTVNGNY